MLRKDDAIVIRKMLCWHIEELVLMLTIGLTATGLLDVVRSPMSQAEVSSRNQVKASFKWRLSKAGRGSPNSCLPFRQGLPRVTAVSASAPG